MNNEPGYLRLALSNIHRDPTWWRKVLRGGAYMLTIVGWPLASGLVVESMENIGNGFATPLPPWVDLGTRYFIGLFALLIDFVLFILPLFVGVALLICVMLATLLGSGGGGSNAFVLVSSVLGGLMGLVELSIFLIGASPVARLMYVDEGRIEEALGFGPVRQVFAPASRGIYLRARLAALPAYLPTAALALAIWGLIQLDFPGRIVLLLVLVWLTLSALLYAHLVVAQIYAHAEQAVQRKQLQSYMPSP